MELILAIIGIGLGVSSLIPIFTNTDLKKKVLFVAVSISIIGIFATSLKSSINYSSKKEDVKGEILNKLTVNGSMTFEQINIDSYYADFQILNDAIDELVDEKKIKHDVIELNSRQGKEYSVRIFYAIDYLYK